MSVISKGPWQGLSTNGIENPLVRTIHRGKTGRQELREQNRVTEARGERT